MDTKTQRLVHRSIRLTLALWGHAQRLRALLKAWLKRFLLPSFLMFFKKPCHLWWTDSKTSLRYTRKGTKSFPTWKRTMIFWSKRKGGWPFVMSSSCVVQDWQRQARWFHRRSGRNMPKGQNIVSFKDVYEGFWTWRLGPLDCNCPRMSHSSLSKAGASTDLKPKCTTVYREGTWPSLLRIV